CNAVITGRSFHARSCNAFSSALSLKCRFLDRCMNLSRTMKFPKQPRGIAPLFCRFPVVFELLLVW
ncbi:hypothetical protein PHYSODRAFT_533289, partial [Phytophthora sojae]